MDVSSRELRDLVGLAAEERARIAAVVRSLPQAVFALDAAGVVVFANVRGQLLVAGAEEEITGEALFARIAVHAQGLLVPRAHLEDAVARGQALAWEDAALHAPGQPSPIPVSVHLVPVHGQTTSVVVTITDLTEARQQEEALAAARIDAEVSRRTERARGTFLAKMSHELRTPLNVILGYVELMREVHDDPAQLGSDLGRVHGAASHLLGLINDILDLSKVDAGKMALVIRPVDVEALLTEVVESLKPLAATSGSDLGIRIDGPLGWMRTDLVKLRQCLFNLIGNAVRFTEDGTITVVGRRRAGWIRLEVEDDGIGIPEDRLPTLFDPFEQAHATTSNHYGGTGLGLAIVKVYSGMLGGSVEVESTEGEGSTFTLVLPAEHSAAPEADRTSPVPGPRWGNGPPR